MLLLIGGNRCETCCACCTLIIGLYRRSQVLALDHILFWVGLECPIFHTLYLGLRGLQIHFRPLYPHVVQLLAIAWREKVRLLGLSLVELVVHLLLMAGDHIRDLLVVH